MKNRAKAVMIGVLMLIIILVSACGANPGVEETMQTQMQDEILQDEDINENEADDYEKKDTDTDEKENKTGIELDDELKEELTAQLITDNNLNTSILKSTKKTKACTFELPDGFEESDDMPGMYLNEHYPVDASTIYYEELDKDTSLQLMSESVFRENMQTELAQLYESDIQIAIETFEKIKINNFLSFRILYSYTSNDILFKQLQYIINADKTYVITYSQTDEYDRMAEYEESAATIEVK